jgi:metallopeptidase family M12-like protein
MALAALLARESSSAAALLSPAAGRRTSLVGVRDVQPLVLDRAALAALRDADRALVTAVPLGRRRTGDLVVERFAPFAPAATAVVVGRTGTRALTLPDEVYFRGTLAGDEGSRALLVAGRERVHGFVVSNGDVWVFGPDRRGVHRSYALGDVDPTSHPPPGDFCANDLHPEAIRMPAEPVEREPDADTAPALRLADIAIDSDQELRAKFASDAAALSYVASLVAAANVIYERDVAVRLRASYVRLWDTTDPWTATSPSGTLSELRTYWNDPANQMATVAGPRTIVHFLSGKAVQGGVAYVGVLCSAAYGYGVSQVNGSYDLSDPSQIWDVLVFAHEVGHNFGSPHTHCYSPPVDKCWNQETGCYSGPVVASRGTIMSYCQLLPGGLANIDLLFGGVVSGRITQTVAAATCLATLPPSTTTTTGTTTSSTSTVHPTTSSSTTTATSSSTTTTSSSTTSSTSTTTSIPGALADSDGDGVPDRDDACPGTPAGELVDGRGCGVCPCDRPRDAGRWSSHAAYVRCVRSELLRRRGGGTLDRRTERSALDAARRSSCGRSGATRCCISGRCRIQSVASCAARAGAADAGPGRCVPSPCGR